jgi:ribonucleoside-diphosphate reductase alpha subunit
VSPEEQPFSSALGLAVARAKRAPSLDAPEGKDAPASFVVDRHGRRIPVRFDSITERNVELCRVGEYGPRLTAIDGPLVTAEVIKRFWDGISTRQLDAETVHVCAQRTSVSSDYESLAARICVSDLHKRVPAALPAALALLEAVADDERSVRCSGELRAVVRRAADAIAARIDHRRDYRLRYFGFQTMLSTLMRSGRRSNPLSLLDTQPCERPQHAYMRVALGIHVCQPDGKGASAPESVFQRRLREAFDLYDALSTQLVSQATPTMLNAGTKTPQMSSCFQLGVGDDLSSILATLRDAGLISKWSGGISFWLHGVRSEGSRIRQTTGQSSGLKYLLRLWNDMQRYVDQGGNRRGAFAATIADHHPDLEGALQQARPGAVQSETGEDLSAADLKYALWVSDEFMEALTAQIEAEARAERGEPADPAAGSWALFDPDEAPGLHLVHNKEFRALRARYLEEKRAKKVIKAGDIIAEAYRDWRHVGNPYVMFKDAINRKSNMQNVAPICSSNLCCEITIPSWSAFDAETFGRFHPGNAGGGEYGVCTLGAVNLAAFVDAKNRAYDYRALIGASGLEVRALDRVIDLNYTPTPECRRSSQRHRTLGIGVIGLADALAMLGLPYDSPEARRFARGLAAAHYYGAVLASAQLAAEKGAYETFEGSPISQGRLQPDLWRESAEIEEDWEAAVEEATQGVLRPADWKDLRARAQKGVRNAYVVAYMPTATSASVVGENESFEPYTANLYTRRTLSGEFTIINRHLVAALEARGLWDDDMRRGLILADGSVQGLERVPGDIKRMFRTAREMHPESLVRMAQAMAPFVCQSLSLNHFMDKPDLPRILRGLVAAWKAGLKTGMYYCHTAAAASAPKTSVASGAAGAPGTAGKAGGKAARRRTDCGTACVV